MALNQEKPPKPSRQSTTAVVSAVLLVVLEELYSLNLTLDVLEQVLDTLLRITSTLRLLVAELHQLLGGSAPVMQELVDFLVGMLWSILRQMP